MIPFGYLHKSIFRVFCNFWSVAPHTATRMSVRTLSLKCVISPRFVFKMNIATDKTSFLISSPSFLPAHNGLYLYFGQF